MTIMLFSGYDLTNFVWERCSQRGLNVTRHVIAVDNKAQGDNLRSPENQNFSKMYRRLGLSFFKRSQVHALTAFCLPIGSLRALHQWQRRTLSIFQIETLKTNLPKGWIDRSCQNITWSNVKNIHCAGVCILWRSEIPNSCLKGWITKLMHDRHIVKISYNMATDLK